MRHSDVKSCVSIYDEDRDRIILFYEGGPKNENQMRKLMESKLPAYMRPGECIRVKRMPGKCQWQNRQKILEELLRRSDGGAGHRLVYEVCKTWGL